MSSPTNSERNGIARKSAHGIVWNYVSFGLGKGLIFVTTAILAHMLTPEDFGVVAFATLSITYLAILKDLGLGSALIQRRENVETTANTVFTLNLLLGLSLTLLGIIIAPLVATFFREPLITPVLRWLSLTFVFNSLGAIHLVRLQRELEFRRKLVPDLGRSLFKGIVSISLALAGFGVWSLVIGQLAGVVVGVVLSWVVFPWLPRLTINTKLVRGLLGYGFSIVGVDTLAIATDNFDYLIIGRILGSASLGIYTLAYRLPELLVLNPLWVMAGALFPAYAKIQHDRDALRQGFLVTMRFIAFICVPLSLGLALVADPLVRVVFGEQWLDAIPIVSVLATFVLVRSIGFNAGDVYKAVGRPDILVKLEVLNFIVLVPALWIGAYYGLVGIALGHLLAGVVRMIADLLTASRFIDIKLKDILFQLKPSLIAGMVLIVFTLSGLYLTTNAIPLVRLIVAMMMGAMGYLSILWLLERDSLLKMSRIVGLPV